MIPKKIKHTWKRDGRYSGAYDCTECGGWTANLPRYRNDVCPVKERRFKDRRKVA